MSWEQATAFFVFAFVAAVTPGPSNVLLAAVGANVGLRRGLPVCFGVLAGMGSLIFVVAFGLGTIILDRPTILTVMKWCGAAFLLWLAWKIASAPAAPEQQPARPIGFFGAAAFQWINPKSWLVSASAAGTYLVAGTWSAGLQAAALAGLFMVAAFPCNLIWLGVGAALQRVLKTPKALRIFNVSMGALLAASVILFVT